MYRLFFAPCEIALRNPSSLQELKKKDNHFDKGRSLMYLDGRGA